jgi:hypothetical protein
MRLIRIPRLGVGDKCVSFAFATGSPYAILNPRSRIQNPESVTNANETHLSPTRGLWVAGLARCWGRWQLARLPEEDFPLAQGFGALVEGLV